MQHLWELFVSAFLVLWVLESRIYLGLCRAGIFGCDTFSAARKGGKWACGTRLDRTPTSSPPIVLDEVEGDAKRSGIVKCMYIDLSD